MRSHPRIQSIIYAVADHYQLPVERLCGPSHLAEYVEPRQVAMWIARKLTPASLSTISRAFGGRHHTTVFSAVKRIESLRRNPEFRAQTDALLEEIRGVPDVPDLRTQIEISRSAAKSMILTGQEILARMDQMEARLAAMGERA